jgi:acyl-CoA thioesterase FadM
VERWGNASFDVRVEGSAADEARFTALITYVSVTPGANTPARIPEIVRERLS